MIVEAFMADDRIVETFDYELGQLHGLPGVTSTRQATVRHVGLTTTATYIIQTFRQRDIPADESEKPKPAKDSIFLEYIGSQGKSFRIMLPPAVADVIARQRDQLTTTSRVKAARQAAQTRKERGIKPNLAALAAGRAKARKKR